MKSSGLLSNLAPIFSGSNGETRIRSVEGTMSLTVFMALCILGLDLLIYVFFHRIYGDKRSAVARQVAALKDQSPLPSQVASRKCTVAG